MNCGEVRDIAAHSLCFRCYRQTEREKERQQRERDADRRHTTASRQRVRQTDALALLVKCLALLDVPDHVVLAIRALVNPFLSRATKRFLNEPPGAASGDIEEE